MPDEMEQLVETPDSDAASNNAAEDHNDAAGQLDNESDSASQEQVEEEEEIEVGERKIALPKSLAAILKSERMMNGDYTQKTQVVAERSRQLDTREADISRQAKEQHEYVKEMASVVAIDEQLAQYNALNWQQIIEADPVQAMQLQQQQKALEVKRAAAETSLTQKKEQIALDKQQGIAKQIQQAEAYIEREIKGVNPERMKALEQYAKAEGMDTAAFAKAIVKSPQIAKFMHKAELYDKLMSKQAPKPPPVAAATPAIRVGSNAKVSKSIGDPNLSDKEFAALRCSQIKNRK